MAEDTKNKCIVIWWGRERFCGIYESK